VHADILMHMEPNGYWMRSSEGKLPRSVSIDQTPENLKLGVESPRGFTLPPSPQDTAVNLIPCLPPVLASPLKSESGRQSDVVADRSTLSWVNSLLGWIWPKANQALMQWVHEDFTPRLQEALPAPFKKAHFSRFTLGRNTPDFGPVEVIQQSDSHVQVDLEIRYISDVDILIDAGAGGITFGINQLKFAGRLCIVLCPLVEKWPLIGAMKWFFCDKPQVALRFSGLASVANYPGMDTQVQKTVDEWVRSRVVLPNSRIWHFTRNEDIVNMMDAASHQPLGVLRARVLRGWNLPGVNWSALAVDRFTSDPYCILSLGDQSRRSSTVQNTTDPVWPVGESSCYFVVYHKEQGLEIDVIGDDSSRILTRNFVSCLGHVHSTTVASIMSSWPSLSHAGNIRGGIRVGSVSLDTSSVNKEMLHMNDPVISGSPSTLEVEAEWFNLTNRQMMPAGSDHPIAVLCVQLHKGTGFPQEASEQKKGLRWRSCLKDGDRPVSRKGQLCDVEQIEFPDVPIHPRLHPVIDKLVARKFPVTDIAQIVGAESPDVIETYLRVKAEYIQKHEEKLRVEQMPDHRVNLSWYETLTHFIQRIESETIMLDLLDHQDQVLGHIGPISLGQLFGNSSVTSARTIHTLSPPRAPEAEGFAAWFTPARRTPPEVVERYSTVQLEVSARLRYLQAARALPRSSGSFLEGVEAV